MEQKSSAISMINSVVVMALAFLMPVFFLPKTSEFFEFNKLALLTVSVLVLLIVWVVKLLTLKRVYTVKSVLNAPITAFVVVYILSTIFSINPNISLFGRYSRWFPSLFGFGMMAVMYYAIAINVTKKDIVTKAINALTAGISINSLVALTSYFGLYIIGSAYARNPNFNFMGSVTSTAILAALAVSFAVYKLGKTDDIATKVIWVQAAVLNIAVVILYNNIAAWVVLAVSLLSLVTALGINTLKKNMPYLMGILGVSAALFIAVILPQTRNVLVNENFAREVSLPLIDSWVVSSSTITDFPLLGTGPSTFGLNFTRYRPLRMNSTDFWNVRFDKPANELFNIMSNLGIFGTVVLVFFVVRMVKFLSYGRKYADDETIPLLVAGILALLVSYLFTYATVLNTFVVFFLLALLTSRYAANGSSSDGYVEHVQMSLSSLSAMSIIGGIAEGSDRRRETFQYFAVIPMILIVAFSSFYFYRAYKAEYYLRKSIVSAVANNGTQTYENQRIAINANPQRAEYRNTYARTNLLLASNLARKQDLSNEDKSTIQTLIAQAIREARLSTEVVNPLAASGWETRANVYKSLIGVADNAEKWALEAYSTAIRLDPTNPRLRLEAGSVYYVSGDYASAANLFRQATTLKADYANAHYNLAQAFKQLKNYPLAQRELEVTLRLLDSDNPDKDLVLQELSDLRDLTNGQPTGNPSVEDLDQQAQIEEQESVTEQEPLSDPENIETINDGNSIDLNQDGNVDQDTQNDSQEDNGDNQEDQEDDQN